MPDLPSPERLVPASVAFFAVTGAVLLIFGEFAALFQVQAITAVLKTVKTGSHHSYAQLVIALAALAMAGLHLATGRRGPVYALAGLAIVSLLITFVGDLPDAHTTGTLKNFEGARTTVRGGFWLELVGGTLVLFGAVLGVLLEPIRRRAEAEAAPGPPPATA